MKQQFWIYIATLALTLSACSKDKVEAEEVNSRTSAIVQNTMTNALLGVSALQNAAALEAIVSSMEEIEVAFEGTPQVMPRVLGGGQKLLAKARASRVARALQNPDSQQETDALSNLLETYIFSSNNLESSDATTATFLIKGNALCENNECTLTACDYSANPGCIPEYNCEATIDEECLDTYKKMQLRIKATLVGSDGVDFVIMFGPDRISPLRIEARPTRLAVEADLGAAKETYEFLAPIMGEESEAIAEVIEGVIRAEIRINGEQDVTLLGSILEAIKVEVAEPRGTVSLGLAASDPLASIHVQGLSQTMSLAINAGAFDLSLPYAIVTENDASTGTFAVHLDGLSASASLLSDNDVLTVTGIGLGDAPSTIKLDDTTLVEVNLNEDSGRRLALEIAPNAGVASFTVTPELALEIVTNLAPIAADDPEIPAYMHDETLGVTLTGISDAMVVPVPASLTFPGGLKVVRGALLLTAASDGSVVQVNEGECLVSDELVAGEHELLGYFAASACP